MALPPVVASYARSTAPAPPPALPQGGRKGKRPPAPVHAAPLAPPHTRYALLPHSWAPGGFRRRAPQLTFPGGSVASPLQGRTAVDPPTSYGHGVDRIRNPPLDQPPMWLVASDPRPAPAPAPASASASASASTSTSASAPAPDPASVLPPGPARKRRAEQHHGSSRKQFCPRRATQSSGSAPLKQLRVGATSAEGVILPPAGPHKGPPAPAQGSGWVHPLNPSGWVYDQHGVRSEVYAVRNTRYPTAAGTALAKPHEQALKVVAQAQKTLDKLTVQLGGDVRRASSSTSSSSPSSSPPEDGASMPARRTRRQAGRSHSRSTARSASPSVVPVDDGEREPTTRTTTASGLSREIRLDSGSGAGAGASEPATAGDPEPGPEPEQDEEQEQGTEPEHDGETAAGADPELEPEPERTPRRKAALMAATRTKTQFQEKDVLKDRSPRRREAARTGTSASPTPSPRPAAAAKAQAVVAVTAASGSGSGGAAGHPLAQDVTA